jgi:parallel beta-helix repeat protein
LQFVTGGIEHLFGDRNIYTNNVVDRASTAGIIVSNGTDIVVEKNTISNCQGDAIAITDGSGVVVRDNVLTANKNDLCNEVGADVSEQIVETTSASCIHY